jgi:hypothetical protein
MVAPEVARLGYMTIWFATAIPSLAGEGPFEVGDWVIHTDAAVGEPPAWVCTAAGTGATATFGAMGNLS